MGGKGMSMRRRDGGGDGMKTISDMTTCVGPFPVKKGDYVTLVAQYDLKKHPLRTSASGAAAADVMGMMGITFASKNGAPA